MYSTVHTSTIMSDDVLKKVEIAKRKLQDANAPKQIKYTYYLRVTSLALEKVQQIEQNQPTATYCARAYSELLSRLIQISPNWWEKCYINPIGLLDSDDLAIYQLLRPSIELHYLVQLLKVSHSQRPSIVFMNSFASKMEPKKVVSIYSH